MPIETRVRPLPQGGFYGQIRIFDNNGNYVKTVSSNKDCAKIETAQKHADKLKSLNSILDDGI